MLLRIIRVISALVLRVWLRAYHRLRIVGVEHLPIGRSFVMVANHASHLDVLCLQAAIPLARINRAYPAAAADYFFTRPIRRLAARIFVNAMPIERATESMDGIERLRKVLEQGQNIVLLFPEGTRSSNGQVGTFKPGVGVLVAGTEFPVVPCHLKGSGNALPKRARFPRPRPIMLTIGKPLSYRDALRDRVATDAIRHELREAVVALGSAPMDTAQI